MKSQKGAGLVPQAPALSRLFKQDTSANLTSICNDSPSRSGNLSSEDLQFDSGEFHTPTVQKVNRHKAHVDEKRRQEEEQLSRVIQEQKEYNRRIQRLRQSVVPRPFSPRRAVSSLSSRRIPDMQTICKRAKSQQNSLRVSDSAISLSPGRSAQTDISKACLSPNASLPVMSQQKQSSMVKSRLQHCARTPQSEKDVSRLRASGSSRFRSSLSPNGNMTAEQTQEMDAALKLRECGFSLRTWEKSYITSMMKLEPNERDIVIINNKQLEELRIPKNVPTSFKTARPRVPTQVENDRVQMTFIKRAAGFQGMLRKIIEKENHISSKVDRTLDVAVKQDKISAGDNTGSAADVPNVVRGSRPLKAHNIAQRTLEDQFYEADGIKGF